MSWRKKDKPHNSPVKLLVWTAVLGLVFGLIGFGQLLEDQLRISRNKLHSHQASGDIVFIAIDDEAIRQMGRWPWPRRHHAELVDKITAAGASRIYFDILFEAPSNPSDDQRLVDAVRRSGKVTLPIRRVPGGVGEKTQTIGPMEALRGHAPLAWIGVRYNYQNAVWKLERGRELEGSIYPSFASSMAGKASGALDRFPIDYSFNPKTIPVISAGALLKGEASAHNLRGKIVLIGTDSESIGDQYFIPPHGKMAGAYVHILGAETLKSGTPVSVGWLAAFVVAIALCWFAIRTENWKRQGLILGLLTAGLILGPGPLEANQIYVDIAPALLVTLMISAALLWRHYKSNGVTNAVSGLPNLTALKAVGNAREQALVVARFLNYAEIVASLPPEAEKILVEQIAARFRVGSNEKTFYHGDGGIFAWFEVGCLPFGNHIDALHAMFRNPVRVGELQFDLSVCFGVEVGSSRTLANRLASALAAAEEAAHDGLRWKVHDPEKLQDATWRLSLLSKLDEAIDIGEVWVAYQPKLDLKTRRIVGAEALARWTHPTKGPIPATDFIRAAEQNDRIGKLTDFVLDHAIAVAARINSSGRKFHIAVNLSARLLSDAGLQSRISAMLIKHLLDPELLTLELTETSAITSDEALQTLRRLRDLGVRISIDDYGTGLSTLDYLKKVPASEIKIDQSFIKGMLESRSDKVMVQSTIALAHSLNRTVVAEGVETAELLSALVQMKCDVAQGFIIGRPMSFDSLRRRLIVEQGRSVA